MAWLIPGVNEGKYIAACKAYTENDVDFFTNPDYTSILGGSDSAVAHIAKNSIENHYGYALTGKETPSELRYINSALEILSFSHGAKKVIEVGSGYGGLCEAMFKMRSFEYYDMVDLPEACAVAQKYLSKYNYPVTFNEKPREYDLFISDSAIAELDVETQLRYLQIAIQCKYIYLVYNTLHTVEGMKGYGQALRFLHGFDHACFHARNANGSMVPNIQIILLWRP